MPGLSDALDHLRAGSAPQRGADLDALAEALARGGAVSARRDLLSELLAVAIDEAGERVGLASTRLLRGEGSAAELRAPLAELGRLLDLFESLEA